MISKKIHLFVILTLGILSGCIGDAAAIEAVPTVEKFNGEIALSFIEQQLSFGPRIPATTGHEQTRRWIQALLQENGWETEVQEGEYNGAKIHNIVAFQPYSRGSEELPYIILGAHYDTRIWADYSENPGDRMKPVPGANDGASGVAVLLELSRILPEYRNLELELVFFDAEDNGRIPGWDWIVGSELFAASLDRIPDAVVIVDMIGDEAQEIYFEKSSDPILRAEIWEIANELGVDTFIPEVRHHILDDHTPFLRRGVTAVDIIDFDYPYWHTTEDTLDKVSASSLENVGSVLQEWLNFRETLGE